MTGIQLVRGWGREKVVALLLSHVSPALPGKEGNLDLEVGYSLEVRGASRWDHPVPYDEGNSALV